MARENETTSGQRQAQGELVDQVALVTGGSRGIGSAIAQALARAGAKIALVARSSAKLDETAAHIRAQGGQVAAFTLDVTDQTAVERLVGEVEQQLGYIDLLVNNAAVPDRVRLIWEGSADDWWRVIEVNLRGPFLCSRAVLPGMIARRKGRIINLATNAAGRPNPVYSAYGVSKAALLRLTDSLAEMCQPYGISVFAMGPGLVRTAMTLESPAFDNVPEEDWTPAERAGELCVRLATGNADALSGRYIHVRDDIEELIGRAEEIQRNDLYMLRLIK